MDGINWREIQCGFWEAAKLWRQAENKSDRTKARSLRRDARFCAKVMRRRAMGGLSGFLTAGQWLDFVFGEDAPTDDKYKHFRAWRADFAGGCDRACDAIGGEIANEDALKDDRIPGWEGNYHKVIRTIGDILEYARETLDFCASLQRVTYRSDSIDAGIREKQREGYRNCVRAIKDRLKQFPDPPFDLRDAKACPDEEVDGLLPRIVEWLEKKQQLPIALGPYLLGYAAGQIVGPSVMAWNTTEAAPEKAKWDQGLVTAAHKNGIATDTNQVSIVAVRVCRHFKRSTGADEDGVYRMPVERVIERLAAEFAADPLCGYYAEVAAVEAEWTERYGPFRGTCWNNDRKRYERERDAYRATLAKEREENERRLQELPPDERKRFEQHKQFFTSPEWKEPAELPPWGGDILREIELRHGVAPDDPRVYSIAKYKAERAKIESDWKATCEAKNWPPAKTDGADFQEWEKEYHLFGTRLADLSARHFGEVGRRDSDVTKSRRHLWAYIKLMVDGVEKVMKDATRIDPNGTLNRVYSALHELQIQWAPEPKDYLKSPTPRERIDELTRIANRLEKDEATEREKITPPDASPALATEPPKPAARKAKKPKRPGRKRATDAEREAKIKADQKLIADCKASGQPKHEFCRAIGREPCGKKRNAVTLAEGRERKRKQQNTGRTK